MNPATINLYIGIVASACTILGLGVAIVQHIRGRGNTKGDETKGLASEEGTRQSLKSNSKGGKPKVGSDTPPSAGRQRAHIAGVQEFSHDDPGYQTWIASHPQGLVVNTNQPDNKPENYIMLHRATCRHITNFDARKPGALTGAYMKVCADDVNALHEWVKAHGRPDGSFRGECGVCKPLSAPMGEAQTAKTQKDNPSTSPTLTVVKPVSPPSATTANAPAISSGITPAEFNALVEKCQSLPPAKGYYLIHDYVENLLLTVLDLQMNTAVVEKAQQHYLNTVWGQIRTHQQLKDLLASRPDTKEGNKEIAQHLWGNNHWTRIKMLRGLLAYFEAQGVTTQEQLTAWANRATFEDFQGKVRGLGPAAFNWLIMRQGVETVKLDVWVRRFLNKIIGHPISDEAAISALEQAAEAMKVKAYELDWRIWEYERSLPQTAL